MLFSPERPSRSVASSGDIAAVPPSTRTAATSVTHRVPLGFGQDGQIAALEAAALLGLMRPGAAASRGGCAGVARHPPAGRGVRRNQYARTGTMVSETSSEESRAMVTVRANGRNSSPARSPTKAIGRKTATVVRVEAVMAPATSRMEVRIAVIFGFAVAEVPLDVLDDHDRVVHHAADRDGQRAEGQDVQRVAGRRRAR